MEFPLSATDRAFRDEVRDWLATHVTEAHQRLADDLTTDCDWARELRREWERELGAAGWIGLSWPAEHGGQAASAVRQMVFHEEYTRARAPLRPPFGDRLLGPTLIALGTEDQRAEFLPGIRDGVVQWCQGFSEPEAGSDLAAVRTTARLHGDTWRLNGQKVWTSQAQMADWIFVLARTDLDAPKHRGLSFLLVPLEQPGIEVRPIRQLTGDSDFNEVFFNDASAQADHVVGGVGNGWTVAMRTLSFERGTAFMAEQVRWEREFGDVVAETGQRGLLKDEVVRQRLADLYGGLQIIKAHGYRTIASLEAGREPEPSPSVVKLTWSQWHQRLGELAVDILGLDATTVGPGYRLHPFQASYLFGRSHTIYAGSSEIQRNIIGERVLGLPR